jgi:hypothetical protein
MSCGVELAFTRAEVLALLGAVAIGAVSGVAVAEGLVCAVAAVGVLAQAAPQSRAADKLRLLRIR